MNDDYISRKAFKEKYLCCGYIPEMAESELDSFPGTNVRPVVYSEWKTNSDRPDTLICSVCGSGYDMWKHDPHNFCPHCGADMRGEKV